MLNIKVLKAKIKSSHYRTFKNFSENGLGITEQGLRKIFNAGKTTEARILQICDLLEIEPIDIASEDWKNKLMERELGEMETGIGYRLEDIMERKGLGVNAFAESIAVSPSTISTIIKRDNCKLNFVQKVLANHKDVSPAWLIMGYGGIKADNVEQLIAAEPGANYSYATLREELDNCRDTVKNLNRLIKEKNAD